MSLQWQLSRSVPEDTAPVGQAILKPDNPYRLIGDHFDELFPDETVFADMYETTGRGAIPPLMAGLVTVFQMLEKVADRRAAEWVASRIDWKYALHLPLTYPGFHFTDLYAFRQRLLNHQQERRLFDELLTRLKGLGVIKPQGKMRTDSTHILAVVERLSQLELITESIRVALRAITQVALEWVEVTLPATFREAYEVRQSEYRLSPSQVTVKLIQAGKDGFWLLSQLDQSSPASVRDLPEVKMLRTVLEQQFPSGPGEPPAARRPSGSSIIESPHETEARRGKKGSKTWQGYKAQVTETCDEEQPHLIVDLAATGALDSDHPELLNIQARLEQQDTLPSEQYVDQGYMSAQNMVSSRAKGIELVGKLPADTHPYLGFQQVDFQIDEATQQVICPAGHTSVRWRERAASRAAQQRVIEVRFAGADCCVCPSFGKCTKNPEGRTLELHPLRTLIADHRQVAQTEAFKTRFKLRAGVEGTISELVRGHGLRFARYRGLTKLRLQGLFTAVAVNLKRLTRWWAREAHRAQANTQAIAAA